MSSVSRRWPSFKSFWKVEVKSTLYRGQSIFQTFRDFLKIWSILYTVLARDLQIWKRLLLLVKVHTFINFFFIKNRWSRWSACAIMDRLKVSKNSQIPDCEPRFQDNQATYSQNGYVYNKNWIKSCYQKIFWKISKLPNI